MHISSSGKLVSNIYIFGKRDLECDTLNQGVVIHIESTEPFVTRINICIKSSDQGTLQKAVEQLVEEQG